MDQFEAPMVAVVAAAGDYQYIYDNSYVAVVAYFESSAGP